MLTWFLRVLSTRTQRRFRDKVSIALERHVARLQATVETVAHQERPEYLDRLSVLRDQVFVLDHLYMSLFSTAGWILRLGATIALLMSVDPALALLAVFALPTVLTSGWRPGVERVARERGAQSERMARHLYQANTTASTAKELRVLGVTERLADAPALRVGGVLRADRPRPLGQHGVAHARLDGVRARVRRRGRLRGLRARRVGGGRAARAGQRRPALRLPRRDGRGDRLPARHLARRVAAAGLARGVRRGPGHRRPAGARPAGGRHPARGRLVHLPRCLPAGARARRPVPARRRGRRGGRRERRRQVDPGQAAGADVRPDRRPDPRRRPAARLVRSRRLARPDGRRLPGLLPLRARRPAVRRRG